MKLKAAKHAGFTLVELMVVVAVVAIIAAIAIPQYTDYVTRSKFTEAHSNLANLRVQMEQSFMDKRTYISGGTTCLVTMPSSPAVKYFTYTCTGTASTYTITATGSAAQGLSGLAFTVNESNTRATTITASTPMATAGYTSQTCWIQKKNVC